VGIQLPPVIFLNKYASRIAEAEGTRTPEDLARALEAQKSFWRYVGIFTLVMLCLYALLFVVGIGTAIMAAGARRI
jgi:hypothetical protein